MSGELILYCAHGSWTGAEGPVDLLGRMPILWKCDQCGELEVAP
jgi:hypothetical protein